MSRHFVATDYVEFLRMKWFWENPRQALISALTLSYLPKYLDILPLYLVLMAAAPFLLALVKRDWRLAVAVSGTIYLAAWFSGVNFIEGKDGQGWYFNPLAWQFLYTIGMVACHLAPNRSGDRCRGTGDCSGLRWVSSAFGVVAAAPWNLTGMVYLLSAILPVARRQDFFGAFAPGACGRAVLRLRLLRPTASPAAACPSGGAAVVGGTPFAARLRGGSGAELRGIRRGYGK